MWNQDPQIVRAIDSLSALIGKSLEVTEDLATDAGAVFPRSGAPRRLIIRAVDGTPIPLEAHHRLQDVLDLIESHLAMRGERDSLHQRLRFLERENAELTVKNLALAEASSRDALTGLYNRWYVLDKIEEELTRAWRTGKSLSLLMLDIDHFKRVNDSYGHPAGDQVLQSIGSVLRESVRVYDIPGRYGGEEFCVILPDAKLENTIPVAERIRRRVEATALQHSNGSIHVTTSIGIAGLESIPEEGLLGASSLIERADRALYSAKDRGRNRVELWSSSLAGTRMGASPGH